MVPVAHKLCQKIEEARTLPSLLVRSVLPKYQNQTKTLPGKINTKTTDEYHS
jgi:hypothetical protein